MRLLLSSGAQVLDEVHDVGAIVHRISFELFEDARVQVFVHVPVLEGVVGGLLRGGGGGVEVLELRGEAHAHFEGVGHTGWKTLEVVRLKLILGIGKASWFDVGILYENMVILGIHVCKIL